MTLCLVALALVSCGGGDDGVATTGAGAPTIAATTPQTVDATPRALRVYHNPYANVAWSMALRIKAQHHDHVADRESAILAYDRAGYNALVLLDYSGNPLLPQALRRRLWPPESVLRAPFMSSLSNLRIFLPGAEEVVDENMHVTSPFLTTYVQRWNPASGPRALNEYETATELRQMIANNGGVPVLAHPWHEGIDPDWTSQFQGLEMYSAFAAVYYRNPVTEFMKTERNVVLLAAWDKALARNSSVIGIAVNDHFGPLPDFPVDADLRDSGKIIVLAEEYSLEAYRRSFERGALFAIKDLGTTKDRYPSVAQIVATGSNVSIDTDGTVRWIAMGKPVADGPRLQLSSLAPGTTYVRAEIGNAEGSVVYTQAFAIRQVGDSDGDGDVDGVDSRICEAVAQGAERDTDRIAACP